MSDIPAKRELQFDLIEVASAKTIQWARDQSIPLKHIYPVVPFVETDFSLDAWLFFDTEAYVLQSESNGVQQCVSDRFRSDLADSGYPTEWLALVKCWFASKEIVDRDFGGSYYQFLR